ncbi:Fc receptor-like protein 5 [Chanodichthys erythropterus]|uniref:Fc receptor-like protein 5 n=1 Tax=Chanodichthys erythropterus TaxID=933992 RepID=UPI00351E481C
METFKIILLTVAVCGSNIAVTSQESTEDPPIPIPKPKITGHPTHKVLYRTETVTLNCVVPGGASEFQYDWYKDSANFKTEHHSSITVTDGGNYECKAKSRTSESEKSDGYTLTLQDLPEARVQSEWTEAFPGENVSLQCVIPVSENWIYKWFKDSENVVSSDERSIKDNTLTLSVKSGHEGDYACQAELKGRTVTTTKSKIHSLKVYDLPEARVQSEWTEAFPGENVSLQCVIPVSENWIYKWFKDSENVVSSDERSIKDNTLTLSVKSGHEGDYACQAELKGRTVTTTKSKIHSLKVYAGGKGTLSSECDGMLPTGRCCTHPWVLRLPRPLSHVSG